MTDLEKVQRDGSSLEHIENQTEEICLAAVKQNGHALMHVKNKTPEICLAAVKQNGFTIKFVENQTHELCMEATKHGGGHALGDIKNQTEEMCLMVVRKNSSYIIDVKDQTEVICRAALETGTWGFEFIREPSLDIILLALDVAIKKNQFSTLYIRHPLIRDVKSNLDAREKVLAVMIDEETGRDISIQKDFTQPCDFDPGDLINNFVGFNTKSRSLMAVASFERSSFDLDKARQDKNNQKAKFCLNKEEVVDKMRKVFND